VIKVAFGSVPKDGGTFTFYRNQRPALAEHGIDLRCVTLGRAEAALWDDAYADDGCVLLVPKAIRLRTQARAFVDWCEREEIDIVMGINSPGILSAIPHLPERVRAMSRCANGFDHGYRITLSGYDRLEKIVALTPRLRDTLVNDYGADPDRVVLIPNGIDPAPFETAAATPRGGYNALRLGFMGRLEHNQKGVLHLPKIVDELNARGVPFQLRIAGKGRDEGALREGLAESIRSGQTELVGALGPGEIPQFLAETDVFAFTSHFEGCPNALLEAMMAGCVPVSWLIEGTTDYLLSDGQTGLICDMGDVEAFSALVADLASDRARLAMMHEAAARDARDRFSNARAAELYADVFQGVDASEVEPCRIGERARTRLPWSAFVGDKNFSNEWRRNLKSVMADWGLRV